MFTIPIYLNSRNMNVLNNIKFIHPFVLRSHCDYRLIDLVSKNETSPWLSNEVDIRTGDMERLL